VSIQFNKGKELEKRGDLFTLKKKGEGKKGTFRTRVKGERSNGLVYRRRQKVPSLRKGRGGYRKRKRSSCSGDEGRKGAVCSDDKSERGEMEERAVPCGPPFAVGKEKEGTSSLREGTKGTALLPPLRYEGRKEKKGGNKREATSALPSNIEKEKGNIPINPNTKKEGKG